MQAPSCALFATNNLNAGVLIGKYARAATKGQDGDDRHAGRACGLVGRRAPSQRIPDFGIKGNNKQIVCVGNGQGQVAPSQTAMENCLQKNPDIDVVYTINEPSAAGAWTALKNAGKTRAVSRSCPSTAAARRERSGRRHRRDLAAVLRMAALGVAAVVKFAKTGQKANTDTGVNLIAKKPVAGVKSKSVAYGLANCWGTTPGSDRDRRVGPLPSGPGPIALGSAEP